MLSTPVQTLLSDLISPLTHLHPQPLLLSFLHSPGDGREPRSQLQDINLIPCDWVTLPQPTPASPRAGRAVVLHNCTAPQLQKAWVAPSSSVA